jgi:hypothetical protein
VRQAGCAGRTGEAGQEGKPRGRPPIPAPKSCTHTDVGAKILHLRQNNHFGPAKISMCLKHYHDAAISPVGVWRILKH